MADKKKGPGVGRRGSNTSSARKREVDAIRVPEGSDDAKRKFLREHNKSLQEEAAGKKEKESPGSKEQ